MSDPLGIEKGKAMLREKGINFSAFRAAMKTILSGTEVLDEDEWVHHYNTYAGCVGSTGFETIKDWAEEFFQEFNKKEHRIWLRKSR